ncbi:MAG: homoserine dehydrogenase [Planctomycetota bacterium]|nr:MAG: homoserine dehydrogenase [Planctomycetota bacterium]REK43553.1 MAG: homoserine dehydrogenase [Planctomycetota bacterium]
MQLSDTTPSNVALVGVGTVGAGVARLLTEQADRLARHAGRPLRLTRAVVRDVARPREVKLADGVLTDDLASVTGDESIRTVVQLVGGLEPARSIMLELLEAGKDVVTANKALLAEHGPELFDRARELGRSIAFEASVAGGIPIITNIAQCLSANEIQSLHGILNGTCNFILTEMEEQETDYATAVAEAQRLGYAEADPTLDVDGSDAAQKLAILAHLAFGARVAWHEIPREGVERIEPLDIHFAAELGYRIKLLAVAELMSEGLELYVSPQLVRRDAPLAEVHGAYNAVRVVGDAVGRVWFHGLGAGQMPTASAVVADLIDTVVGRSAITFRTLELWSQRPPRVSPRDHQQVESRYYFRFSVKDDSGVLAEIASVLGRFDVSIASVIQHETGEEGSDSVPIVLMTHKTTEGAAQRATAAIDQLDAVRSTSVRMRVAD